MSEVLTLAEMERRFPDEWVLILEPDTGPDLKVRSGTVAGHGPDRDELYRKAAELNPKRCAVYFMGDPVPAGMVAFL